MSDKGERKTVTRSDIDFRKLRVLFAGEGESMLAYLNHFILKLVDNEFSKEDLDSAYRAVHSLKSEAAFLEYTDIEENAHSIEGILQDLKSTTDGIREKKLQDLLQSFWALEKAFLKTAGERGSSEKEPSGTASEQSSRSDIVPVEEVTFSDFEQYLLQEAQRRGAEFYCIECTLSADTKMPYPRFYLIINNLEQLLNVIKTVPSLEQLKNSSSRSLRIYCTGQSGESEITEAVSVDQLEEIGLKRLDYSSFVSKDSSTSSRDSENKIFSDVSSREYLTLQVGGDKFDNLLFFTSRLNYEIINLANLSNKKSYEGFKDDLRHAVKKVSLLFEEVETNMEDAMRVDLVETFLKLKSYVLRVAEEQEKKVEYTVAGCGVRSYLPLAEEIAMVVTHVLKNAVDHGIENPGERIKSGKRDAGMLKVSVEEDDDSVMLSISDDGRGIDLKEVQEIAAEKNIPVEGRDELALISSPGFTSRENASKVSGRGVGLDIVKREVEDVLQGSILLKTVPGKGSSFIIRFKKKLHLLSILVFRAGDEHFAVPDPLVEAIVDLDDTEGNFLQTETYLYRDTEMPVLNLHSTGERVPVKKVIILSFIEKYAALPASELLSQETVVYSGRKVKKVYSKTTESFVDFFNPMSL
jgi:two-component system chemotaxis sensor kinase CheA